MCEEMLAVSYLVLIVYRVGDLICDWNCLSHFKEPISKIIMVIMLFTCLIGTLFNLWYLYRALVITCRMLRIPFIGRMRSPDNILSELNFHVIEVINNIAQAFLGGVITLSNMKDDCFDPMNLDLEYCCCFGAVIQFLCFSKNVASKGDRNFVNVIGLCGSFISAVIGFFSIAGTSGLRICSGS